MPTVFLFCIISYSCNNGKDRLCRHKITHSWCPILRSTRFNAVGDKREYSLSNRTIECRQSYELGHRNLHSPRIWYILLYLHSSERTRPVSWLRSIPFPQRCTNRNCLRHFSSLFNSFSEFCIKITRRRQGVPSKRWWRCHHSSRRYFETIIAFFWLAFGRRAKEVNIPALNSS